MHSNVSVGIAHSSNDSSVEALLRDADIAMYLAKRSGKGHHEVFQPGMRQEVMDRLELRSELAEALAHNEFVLHYQPIVEVTTGRPVGVEALLRWEHPAPGQGRADAVHPARRRDRADHPDRSVGADGGLPSCRRARSTARSVWRSPSTSRPSNCAIPGLVDDVLRALDSAGLDPSRLILELTESAVVSDIDAAAITLCELRTHGVRIALDDFGAGYASLRHLRAFPVDIVKLDRSFVVNSLENDSTVLSGLIAMASSLGMETVGRGSRSRASSTCCAPLNCRYAQGYLISRPMPSDRLDDVYAIGGESDASRSSRSHPNPTSTLPGRLKNEHLFDTLHRVSSLAERFPALTAVAASERTLPVHESLVEAVAVAAAWFHGGLQRPGRGVAGHGIGKRSHPVKGPGSALPG